MQKRAPVHITAHNFPLLSIALGIRGGIGGVFGQPLFDSIQQPHVETSAQTHIPLLFLKFVARLGHDLILHRLRCALHAYRACCAHGQHALGDVLIERRRRVVRLEEAQPDVVGACLFEVRANHPKSDELLLRLQ